MWPLSRFLSEDIRLAIDHQGGIAAVQTLFDASLGDMGIAFFGVRVWYLVVGQRG